jgi:DNA-binding transcriptional regulator YiaG
MKAKKASVGARIIQGLEEFVETLEKKEPVAAKFTCRVVELDLRPTPYGPERVKSTRKLLNVSQAVFARLLGVAVNTVRAWEQGVNTPQDVACRFMDEIRRNPAYWVKRLKESTVVK